MRFTSTEDRDLGIFKHTRGTLVGWQLDPLDAARARSAEPEIVLERRPVRLLVRVENAEWTISAALGQGRASIL